MHAPQHDPRSKTHTRSFSTPVVTVSTRKRKNSAIAPHQLLRINTQNLHLAAPPVVNLTRLNSPSLASFTPFSESIDSQGPASGSLRAHIHVRSESFWAISKGEDSPSADSGIAGIELPPDRPRPRLFSLFEFSSTIISHPASPIALDTETRNLFSTSPPSSPSLSIPSISRTHSTTASSSIPRTPPLPLVMFVARRPKKRNRETMSDGRKRAPSLPRPPDHRRLDPSPSRNHARERAFSVSERSNTARPDRKTTSRSRSPGYMSYIPCSNSPSSPQSLAALEASSKFMRTISACAICGTSGPDYPRCSGCGDAWCSRACRMTARRAAGGGEGTRGHGCKGKRAFRG